MKPDGWKERMFTGPQWAWDTIWETLAVDAQSSAFDPALRHAIAKATEEIEEVTD